MSESPPHITNALLRVVVDPGHNGPAFEYRIDAEKEGYAVTLRISRLVLGPGGSPVPPPRPPSPTPRPLPAPGGSHSPASQMTQVLAKDRREVEEFLRKLSAEFDVYALTDLEPPYPFLHPTFYSFSFRDAAGRAHSFEYRIECSSHLDARYERLVRAFDTFFESERAFAEFLERQRRGR